MTLTELITDCRSQYNASGDSFFSDAEMLRWIYAACMELSRKAFVIEQVYSASTVISQQQYDYPSNTISIKRVTWYGTRLFPVTMKEDDVQTLSNQATTEIGDPKSYFIWKQTLYLRPVPSSVQTLEIYSYNEPSAISAVTSTLEVPSEYHTDLIYYVCHRMALKDRNIEMSQAFLTMWMDKVKAAKAEFMKRKRGDSFQVVKDHESLPWSILGSS